MPDGDQVLSWLHIGDLNITDASEPNHRDLQRLVDLMRTVPAGSVDFAVLPGDNAENGTPAQYNLVREAMARLPMPVHILPGDHDFKPRTLDAFYEVLGADRLPKAVTASGHRCLFLDVVSAGTGGPDFRLGSEQLDWAEREIGQAAASGQGAVVFMHTYPADLRDGAARLLALLGKPHVTCVDMGHTHYNELANDGETVFMATRSTGQIEEGQAGFSMAAIDGSGVSWRFKPLDAAWPFVLITRPTDRRLATHASRGSAGIQTIRAKVLSDAPVLDVAVRADDGDWMPMRRVASSEALWEARGLTFRHHVSVRAHDAQDRTDEDRIEPPGEDWTAPKVLPDGSDLHRIGAWPERGILGTQLGPNRRGRKW